MSTNKVWFHTGSPCHGCGGIGAMWREMAAAGVPFAVYSVENGGLIAEAAAYPGATLIYRSLATDVASYDLAPAEAARRQWSILMSRLPPEVKALAGRCWIEVGNEQDKTRANWLGWYYVELAGLAATDGYRICGPGWATGEPEPADWETEGWLAYLRLCAAWPDQLAVSVHEYSLNANSILAGSPWLVGRVGKLYEICDRRGISRPTTFVTELGWTHDDLPAAERAKADIAAAAALYAAYPTVQAAFLWSLMGGGDKKTLAAELNALMPWLTRFAIETRFPDAGEQTPTEPEPEPEPEPMPRPIKLLDVSKWQATIDAPDMKSAGIDGVMLRASYATSSGVQVDERVDAFAAQLKAAGIPFGFYHYYHPRRSGASQFEVFRAVVERHGFNLPLALDLEEKTGLDGNSAAEMATFGRLMREAFPLPVGKRHLIYTSLGYWRDLLRSPAWGAEFDLWIAAWTAAATPLVPAPWTTWRLWQHTSDGDGPAHGVGSARVDLNRFNGDDAAYAAWRVDGKLSFAAILWNEAIKHPTRLWDTSHALPKAMLADGIHPLPETHDVVIDRRAWRFQIGVDDANKPWVYYAEIGKWSDVRRIDGPDEGTTTRPPTGKVDVLPYLRGTHRRQFDMGYSGGTQTTQVWHLGEADWLYIKGDGQYERLGLRMWQGEEWIFRFEDTSESPTRFYAHYLTKGGEIGAPWFPRYAEVGRWYETGKYVQHYLKAGCVAQNGGPVTDRLRLASGPRTVSYAESGAAVARVITVEWAGGEQYDFADGGGNIAFRDATRRFWFIGIVEGRADRPYKKPGCIQLGW